MKPQNMKDPRRKTGVSGLWLAVAAAVGAAAAYLGDPERGNARRQAAARHLSGVGQAATQRTSRWRQLVSARLSGKSQGKPPEQVVIPHDEPSASQESPPPPTGAAPPVSNAKPKKPGA